MTRKSATFANKQAAVVGAEQRRHAARELPAVDDAGGQHGRDADDAERRKPKRRRARDRDRGPAAVLAAAPSSTASGTSAPTHAAAATRCSTSAVSLNNALDARACGGMTRECQCPDEARTRTMQRHAAPPRRCGARGERTRDSRHRKQRDQHGASQPDIAEVGVRQHRPDDAFGPHRGQRPLAHLRRQHDEPGRAGEHDHGKARPRRCPRAAGAPARRRFVGRRPEMPARRRTPGRTRRPPPIGSRRNGRHAPRSAGHVPRRTGDPLLADLEGEIAVDLVRVRRHRLPLDSCRRRAPSGGSEHPDDHAIGLVDGRIALVDLLAGRIPHDDGTEFWLQLLAETQRDFGSAPPAPCRRPPASRERDARARTLPWLRTGPGRPMRRER